MPFNSGVVLQTVRTTHCGIAICDQAHSISEIEDSKMPRPIELFCQRSSAAGAPSVQLESFIISKCWPPAEAFCVKHVNLRQWNRGDDMDSK
jgi:hypothetical protein